MNWVASWWKNTPDPGGDLPAARLVSPLSPSVLAAARRKDDRKLRAWGARCWGSGTQKIECMSWAIHATSPAFAIRSPGVNEQTGAFCHSPYPDPMVKSNTATKAAQRDLAEALESDRPGFAQPRDL